MFGFLKKLFGPSTPDQPARHPPAGTPEPVSDIRAPKPATTPAATPQSVAATANGATRYVIVGAGPAGVIAAETLRKLDRDGDILLVHGENGPPYSRMAIP